MVSLRLPADLAEWATSYAQQRGVSRTDLLASAIESYKEDCEAGVPEIKELRKRVLAAPKATPTRDDFARATRERAELFSKLRCPQSIKGIKKPGVLS